MDSTSARDSTYQYPLGFDTPSSNTISHPECKEGVSSGPSPWHTPPPDALGRPYSLYHDSDARQPTTNLTTSFGGVLDSPMVQLKPRGTTIPLSPPPTLPTTQVNLPPFNDTHNPTLDEPSKIDYNDSKPSVERPRLHELPAGLFESYSPPLSPVGTSPSFTPLALSFAPIAHRGEGSLISSASSTTPTSHDGGIITPSPDPRVLLSPLSPEWDTDFVDEDENDAPLSIDAVLSGVGPGGAKPERGNGGGNSVGELDDLGLADDEGRDTFAFAGFLTRGSSKPRLSMLEIPPSAYPAATLSPSSYYPSATSPTVSSLWTVDATPTSPSSSSSTLWAGARVDGGHDEVKHTATQAVRDLPFGLASSSPHVDTIDLFPSTYDDFDDSFNAYDSPQSQCTALPGLLASPHVSLGDLPEDGYGEPTLLLSSDDRHSLGRELASPMHRSLGLDLDTRHVVHSTCNDWEEANLVSLLEKYQSAEKAARKQEDEALEAIAAIRSPGSKPSRLSPALEKSHVRDTSHGLASPPLSMTIAELQKLAADARRTAKKARTRAKEVSTLLRLKAVEQPESSLFSVSPVDPLLESPSPPMLFEPLDDTTATSSPARPAISPPLSSLQMDGFATSPPIFGSSNKSMSRKKKGGSVDHLVAKMILNRREAGCGSTSSSSSGASNCANAKPLFLSPLLGHHHQLQLQQRYKFLRSSPLARSVITLSPYTSSTSTNATPSPLVSMHLDSDALSNGPSRSNSLDSTCSTDTACSSSSGWSEWDSDGETSLGEDDIDDFRASSKHGSLLGSLDDEDEDADEDVEMGFQALKTPLMWGMDLGFDSGFEEQSGSVGDEAVEGGEDGLLPAL